RRLKFIVRAFNIADRDDCVMVSADEDELFKQHCHTVDRIVTALCQAVDSKLDFDCPCGSLTSALLSICSHHIGFRCCQNAVAKYAATSDFFSSLAQLDCAAGTTKNSPDYKGLLVDQCHFTSKIRCFISLAHSAVCLSTSIDYESLLSHPSWKFLAHCLANIGDDRIAELFWQRALKQAAIDGQPKLVERYHSKLAVGREDRVLGLLLNESDAVTEQHIAIGLKILPRIESPANRWRFCLEAAERVARLGRSNLLEELIKLLPPPLPDDQLLERRITPKQKLLILVAETAATGGDLRTAAWAAGTADCAAMED
uniref:Nuclear pore complex protein Nup85 n=1 Tax=Macrostomum lignano TaxID=282301 RepID=A0A1I8HCH3_9PLAT